MIDPKDIRLDHTGIVLTFNCNLRCKLCLSRAPIISKKIKPYAYERLVESFDKYFSVVKYVRRFSFTGGEPFLRTDLAELVEYTMRYREQFGFLEIVTNGTLMPSEKLLASLRKYRDKVDILVDDYGSLSPAAEQAGALLTENGIKNRVRCYYGENCHCGGWVDYGDFSMKHSEPESRVELYQKCASSQIAILHLDIYEGLCCNCAHEYHSFYEGVVGKDDFVDLLDESKSIEQLQCDIVTFVERKYSAGCAYCNGLCKDSERFMPAEQLGDME